MPWKETLVMDERMKLVQLVEEGESVAEAARQLGVSRKTAHKWLERYSEHGVAGLADQSRAPHNRPTTLQESIVERILLLRVAHPTWGPRKLKHWLQEHEPQSAWPAASTIGALLKDRDLVTRRRKKRPLHPHSQPLAHCDGPNRVWCADFKGWFRTGDGQRCDPLTATDGFSRYLLCLKGLTRPTHAGVQPLFDAAFREFGLPTAIRTDNGVPFASTCGLGLSRLSVWWIDLGITPERITPGKPQQNGRHERMHRTLKADTLKPPAENLRCQQERFDRFRRDYNLERPHEALKYQTPASVYTSSTREYPVRITKPEYDQDAEVLRVYEKGSFRYQGTMYFLADILGGKDVALKPTETDGKIHIYYRHVTIALLDLELKRISPVSKKKKTKKKKT